ncbi:MAG: ATP-binding protein [Holophaga sp.]|nr:ATP-binding protein [Holophaga sp.]
MKERKGDGPGFPPAFTPGKSGGLGYSIVLGLAEQLKGRVTVGEGPGARVSLTFPDHGP